MANPQPDQFTKLSNELFEAIMKTDFSKRQRNILDLVIRLSYGCRKKFAILRSSDFEVVGILRGHVKKELDYLQMANVLHIDGEIYTLNKDYDSWRVSISKTFNVEKYQKILSRNIQQNVTETVTKVIETVTENNDQDVTEIVTVVTETVTNPTPEFIEELPKQEQDSYQNSNCDVTKTVTGTPFQPNQDAVSKVPKDSIKESIKDSSTRSLENSASTPDTSFGYIYKIYEENIAESGKVSSIEADDLSDQFDTYGGEWLLEAMREAVRANKRTLAYINGVLNGFRKRGTCKKEKDIEVQQEQSSSDPMFDENDPIMQMLLKEDRLRRGTGAPVTV